MKRLFTLILILFCFAEVKGQILWERIEKDTITTFDWYHKVMVKDSLIFLHGDGNNYSVPRPVFYDCYNLNGRKKWRKIGRRASSSYGQGDLIIDDNNYLATYRFDGNYYPGTGGLRFEIQKIDMLTGDTLPSVRHIVPFSYKTIPPGTLIKEPNGSYMIGGNGIGIPSLVKLNSFGAPVWKKEHNTYNPATQTGGAGINSFIKKSNGNYVSLGGELVVPLQSHSQHAALMEFSQTGNLIRKKTNVLTDTLFYERDYYSSLIQTRKGDFLFTGLIDTVVDNGLGFDAKHFVAKADDQFNIKWVYGNKGVLKNHFIIRVTELADSSFAVLAKGSGNYAIINIDKNGNYLTHISYSNAFCHGSPGIRDWKILPDGTAIVAGICKYGYTYLARVTGFGAPAVLGNSEEIENADNYLTEAYPNPANEMVTFIYNLPDKVKQAEIQIYEIATGKVVQQIPLSTSEKQQQISLAQFNSGMYAYSLIVDGIPVSTKKLVVVK